MKKYVMTAAAHVEGDTESLIAMAVLGDNIERALLDRTNPFCMLLDQARDAFLANTILFLDADLHTTAGIELARSQQAEARRYRDMCRWIDDALQKRAEAHMTAEDEMEDFVTDDLKEQLYGSRAKPAPPDA